MSADRDPVACALCGSTVEVGLYSPDMDIRAVPFCKLCLFTVVLNPDREAER